MKGVMGGVLPCRTCGAQIGAAWIAKHDEWHAQLRRKWPYVDIEGNPLPGRVTITYTQPEVNE